MSADADGGFAPPPFKPEESLLQLKRALRDLKLAERSNGFEQRGKPVLELKPEPNSIQVRLARRLVLTPEWDTLLIRSAADQRKVLDELKKRLARWEHED